MTSVETKKGLGFDKSQRLLNASDYSAVFDAAQIKVSHPAFLILARANHCGYPRLGLVIAKKNVRLATHRNQIKRLIRESFRLKQHHLPAIDAIVLARRDSDKATKDDIHRCLNKLWKRVVERANKN